MSAKVLVIGSGGREHALAWKLSQSPKVTDLYVAPGNGGTSQIAENISINATDIDGLVRFAKKNAIDLTVVGPDDPLAAGIVDTFQKETLRIFGPTRAAAEIEWSKVFAKRLMRKCGILTAPFAIFQDHEKAQQDVYYENGTSLVVKADGLALGKGAYVCHTVQDALLALQEIMVKRQYGNAGNEVVIEDFLEGQEVSIHAFCDGKSVVLFPPSQDHKPIFDGDQGRNTGGMGTITPVPWFTAEFLESAKTHIVTPALNALKELNAPFVGCLYPGLKATLLGLVTLEFNARFGDPETQSYMRLLKTDLFDILWACVHGTLSEIKIEWYPGFAVCIVLASEGYPGPYKKGIPIFGIDQAEKQEGIMVFHAGTTFDGQFKTSGGRVLGVTAVANTLKAALERAYKAVTLIHFEGMHYRKDIGAKALT